MLLLLAYGAAEGDGAADDVADPFGEPLPRYLACLDQMAPALRPPSIASLLQPIGAIPEQVKVL